MKSTVLALMFCFCLCFSSRAIAAFGPEIDKTPVFEENFDKDKLDETVWKLGTWKEHKGQLSPDRLVLKDGMLNMVLRYDGASKTVLSSALQTKQEFLYGRWEFRAKIASEKGVLNSFYTIDWGAEGKGTKQEIDIEFLTIAKNKVHLAVHMAGKKSTSTSPDIDLGFNASADFHVYGFEITPEKIEWLADGKVIYTYNYSGNDIKINSPYLLKLNTRGDSGWVKGPPKADTDCIYQIDWIKFYPMKEKAK